MKTLRPLVSWILGAALLAAQDEATTLDRLARQADVVVRATVVAATDPSPEWHRLRWRRDEVLRGAIDAEFELLEPAGACCGRSLFALQTGAERLLFLRRTGPTLHPLGGARGVVPALPELLLHVSSLLAAGNEQSRAHLLAASLQHPEPRIADDAAATLATLPVLALDAPRRAAVVAALTHAVQRGATRSAPLINIAVRLADPEVLDACLPLYLDTPRADQAALLRRALLRGDGPQVVNRLPLHVAPNGDNALRAAELLGQLPPEVSRPALQRLLQGNVTPRVQLCLAEGLLAAGMRPPELAPLVPAPVLQLAQRRHDTPRRLRHVQPFDR